MNDNNRGPNDRLCIFSLLFVVNLLSEVCLSYKNKLKTNELLKINLLQSFHNEKFLTCLKQMNGMTNVKSPETGIQHLLLLHFLRELDV